MLRFMLMLSFIFSLSFLFSPFAMAKDGEGHDAHQVISLSEAHIFPKQFISEESIAAGAMPSGGRPSPTITWRADSTPELSDGIGYAGYWRDLPPLSAGQYEIAFDFATSAYEAILFPKGHPERSLRIAAGRPGVDAASEIPFIKRQILSFHAQANDEWVLVLNVSNFHRTYGGFWEPPKLSPAGHLQTQANIKTGLNFAVAGSMIIIMLYTYMLFNRRRSDLPAFFLSMTCVAILLRLIGIENLESYFVETVKDDFTFQVVTRLEYGSMALVTMVFLEFLRRTFTLVRLPRFIYLGCHALSASLLLVSLMSSPIFFSQLVGLYQFNVLIHVLCMFYITFKAFRMNEEGAGYMLSSALVPLIAGVIDVVQSRSGSASYISHFGGAIFIFLQSQILAKRFAKAFLRAEHLSLHLQQEVAHQTHQIRNIMDNVPEGLFTIGRDLRIQGHCSKYVNVIFPDAMLHNLPDLLIYNTTIDRSNLDMAVSVLLTIIGEDSISWDINGEHLFTELETHDQKLLTFQWHPIVIDDRVEEMLIIVRDTTELRDLRLRTLYQEQEMVLISTLAKAKIYHYTSFMEQAQESVKTMHSVWNMNHTGEDQSYIRLILAVLHTLKGNSRQIGFAQLAKEIHGFEQNIIDLRETHGEEGADFSHALANGLLIIASSLDMIDSLHKRYWGDTGHSRHRLMFQPEDIQRLQSWVDGRQGDNYSIKRLLRERLMLSFTDQWKDLQAELTRLAGELGKAPPRLTLSVPEDLWFGHDFQNGLLNALGHILRNSIDHGIEDGRARIEAGKDMCGRIDIVGEWQEDQLR
ncbi:MAG: hypothetical protein EOP07_06070, partial [Proteobacteria bacterium]